MMESQWISEVMSYDGSQLQALFNYRRFGILGPSCIVFRGPCSVKFDHMVDLEDLRAQSPIEGSDMVHFLVEIFDRDLFSAVALQRLLADLVRSSVENLTWNRVGGAIHMKREGDDLYWEERKFSISIASVSPVSQLIHFAVNVSNLGTPVPTCALEEFGIEPEVFGRVVMARLQAEYMTLVQATQKVRPIGT